MLKLVNVIKKDATSISIDLLQNYFPACDFKYCSSNTTKIDIIQTI